MIEHLSPRNLPRVSLWCMLRLSCPCPSDVPTVYHPSQAAHPFRNQAEVLAGYDRDLAADSRSQQEVPVFLEGVQIRQGPLVAGTAC